MSHAKASANSQRPLPVRVPAAAELRDRDERLDAMKALTGQLAHDFNNFLAPLLGYITLIKEETGAGSSVLQYAGTMENAARKTEKIIDEVLSATRGQRSGSRRAVDFAQLVRDELAAFATALPANTKVTIRSNLESCSLWLDAAQWKQSLQELLQNARFALATGGTLEVSLTAEQLPAELTAQLGLPTGDVVQLVFRDDGFGMSETTARRAFEPFFTTRPKSQGQGLGLAFVHTVVRAHEGQVVLESEPEVGTSVAIWLPVLNAQRGIETASVPTARSAPAVARRSGMKILVVDDDPMVLEVTKSCLQRARHEVLVARDGDEGLKLYRKHELALALVISDVTMPVMNGIEMSCEIRKINPTVPIIYISGAPDSVREDAVSQVPAPKPRMLKKPFRLNSLLSAVREVVG